MSSHDEEDDEEVEEEGEEQQQREDEPQEDRPEGGEPGEPQATGAAAALPPHPVLPAVAAPSIPLPPLPAAPNPHRYDAFISLTKSLGWWSRELLLPQFCDPAPAGTSTGSAGAAEPLDFASPPPPLKKRPVRSNSISMPPPPPQLAAIAATLPAAAAASPSRRSKRQRTAPILSTADALQEERKDAEMEPAAVTTTAAAASASDLPAATPRLKTLYGALPAHPYQLHALIGFESDVSVSDEDSEESQARRQASGSKRHGRDITLSDAPLQPPTWVPHGRTHRISLERRLPGLDDDDSASRQSLQLLRDSHENFVSLLHSRIRASSSSTAASVSASVNTGALTPHLLAASAARHFSEMREQYEAAEREQRALTYAQYQLHYRTRGKKAAAGPGARKHTTRSNQRRKSPQHESDDSASDAE